MAARYPTQSTRGRLLKPTRKLRERLKDQVQHEYNALVGDLMRTSQILKQELSSRRDSYIVEEIYTEWMRVYEEMLDAEREVERFLPEEESDAHRAAFSADLRHFRQIQDEAERFLRQVPEDEPESELSFHGAREDEAETIKRRIAAIEKDIGNATARIEQTRMQESQFRAKIDQKKLIEKNFVSTPRRDYPGFPETPGYAYKPETPKTPRVDDPLAYRGQFYHHMTSRIQPQSFVEDPTGYINPDRRVTPDYRAPRQVNRGDQVTRYEEDLSYRSGEPPPNVYRYDERYDQVPITPYRVPRAPVLPAAVPLLGNLERERLPNQGREFRTAPPGNEQDPTLSILDRLASILQDKKEHRLPSIEPEKFSGDIMKFPSWMASFEALIERKFRSSGERMFYLQKYTTGEARDLLTGFEDFQSEDTYPNAKMLMINRYGDKLRISETYKQKLNDWPILKAGDHAGLQKYSDFLWKCFKAMETIGYLSSLNSPEENRRMVKKMPFYVIDRWQRVIDVWVYDQPADYTQLALTETRPYPPFLEFCKFISNEARVANGPCSLSGGTSSAIASEKKNDASKRNVRKTTSLATKSEDTGEQKAETKSQARATPSQRKEYKSQPKEDQPSAKEDIQPRCWFCDKDHWISSCDDFLTSPFEDKKTFAMSKGLCFGCLRRGHTFKTCRIRRPELMRDPNRVRPDEASDDKKSSPSPDKATNMSTRLAKADGYCSSILPVWVSSVESPDDEVLTYVVVDSQSDSHFMTPSLAEKLKMKSTDVSIRLVTMGTTAVVPSSIVKGTMVRGWNQTERVEISKCYTRDIIPANKATIPSPEDVRKWSHLSAVADELMEVNDDIQIELMIGFKCSDVFIQEERVFGKANEPFGYKSALGWSVMGRLNEKEDESTDHLCFITSSKEMNHEQIKKVFDMGFETYGKEETMSQDDKRFLQLMKESIIQRPDGHMQTDLPLKNPDPNLPCNRVVAEKRLKSLKRKLSADKEYSMQYTAFINNMIEKGQAELVGDEDPTIEGLVWYLPHMGVYHPRKPTKLRVVFDASAKFLSVSLNECLLSGPDLTNSLIGVMLRFRCEKIALTCDVEGMFHQVFVSPRFRDLLRFLWFRGGNPDAEIEEYRVTVNLFGASSSPGCCNYAFQEVARRFEEEYGALTAAFILKHFYVDDGIISVKSVEEAVDLIFSSNGLCREGGFHLHKYTSNSQAVLDQIPDNLKSEEARTLRLDEGSVPAEMMLGVGWNRLKDCFVFLLKMKMDAATRRGMLSSLSSIYDPLGFLGPVILVGRIILRDVCMKKFDWDEEVGEEIQLAWRRWYEQLQSLSHLEIPRCLKKNISEENSVQIHVFCDASTVGYGACGYVRLTNEEGEVETSLVLSKSRVGPAKSVTIPRLELQAAVLAVKVGGILQEELPYTDPEMFYWSDSQVALGYIRNSEKRFHVYVSNRVASIREMSNVNEWHYIETEENPADIVSRGAMVETLIEDRKWWKGPQLIQEENIEMPEDRNVPLSDEDPEVKLERVCLSTALKEDGLLDGLTQLSTWKQMKKSVAIWLRFMKLLKLRKEKRNESNLNNRPISAAELRAAERIILINVQKRKFAEVYAILDDSKKYPVTRNEITKRKAVMRKYTNLYKLDTYLDDSGLLRVGGRIKRASMSHEMKHPILLPRNDYVATKIIQHFHSQNAHSGRGITMMSLRSAGYWVVNGRSEIDKALRRCVICRKLRGIPLGQRMGDLPKARVEEAPPFSRSGMDVFGPFEVKVGRSLKKRWICIFVCMAMRGIHVEVLHYMDISSFISAFRRFEARRGAVKELYSDRGSNFIGSKNEMNNARKEMSVDEVSRKLAENDCEFVQFNFNYPKSSHMGGSWERMIRTVRGVMARLLSEHGGQLDDELLLTLMAEAESIVNSRPITYASMSDANDVGPLTPMQLLTLKSQVVLPPPGVFVREDLYCSRRWRRVQYLANLFWSQWSRDFVPTLQERRKWVDAKENVQVEDIVLIADANQKRNKWLMGRVITVAAGEDDLVRKATIKTATGELERPIHKLVFLYRPADD